MPDAPCCFCRSGVLSEKRQKMDAASGKTIRVINARKSLPAATTLRRVDSLQAFEKEALEMTGRERAPGIGSA